MPGQYFKKKKTVTFLSYSIQKPTKRVRTFLFMCSGLHTKILAAYLEKISVQNLINYFSNSGNSKQKRNPGQKVVSQQLTPEEGRGVRFSGPCHLKLPFSLLSTSSVFV